VRQFPPGLADHLATGTTTLCHCWKLAPRRGAALGFTDHDHDITFDGVTFEAQAGFAASEIESSLGLAVDNLEASGALSSAHLDEARLRAGDFDHATIEIWKANWRDVSQRILLRKGHLGEVTYGGTGFTAEVRGLSHLLNQTKGRVYQFGCDAAVGDARCGVDLETAMMRVASNVVSVEDSRRFSVTSLGSFANGWFSQGTLIWTSGHNTGRREEVKSHTGNVIELWQAAGFGLNVGDGLILRAGCDKQFATCKAKFSNTENFRGFPHLPGTDFVVSYAAPDDQNNNSGSRNR
jgi:uncharacterized phage protein (TIGR02218 family)